MRWNLWRNDKVYWHFQALIGLGKTKMVEMAVEEKWPKFKIGKNLFTHLNLTRFLLVGGNGS